MRKRTIKKLTLSRESIICLDPSELREVGGGWTQLCTNTVECTTSCQQSCACSYRIC